MTIYFYSLISVLIVSLISFAGLLYLAIKKELLQKILLYLVAFSVGALFGDVFLHILPELGEEEGLTAKLGFYIVMGILLFFVIEKFIHWHHCHRVEHTHDIKPMAYTNLIGDGFHNFLDGAIIAGSFMVSIPVGIATTVAVILHEIPQEIGDFGVLLYAGFSHKKALFLNFISALVSVVGCVFVLILGDMIPGLNVFLLCLAAGGFIYIAGSDLIPELHKEEFRWYNFMYQFLAIVAGVALMAAMLLLE